MKKYYFIAGIIAFFALSSFLDWSWRQLAVHHMEEVALAKMGTVERGEGDVFLPTIEVAGPSGDLVRIPDKEHFMLINIWSVRSIFSVENLKVLRRMGSILTGYGTGKDWRVIGVSVDEIDDLESVLRTLKRHNMREVGGYYDVHKALLKEVKPKSLPVTLIVDDHGRILYTVYGNVQWLDPDITDFIRSLQRKETDEKNI